MRIATSTLIVLFVSAPTFAGDPEPPTTNPAVSQPAPPTKALLTKASLLGIDSDGDGIRDDIEALAALQDVDARLVQVVEMRFFAGMTEAEVADALGVADRTVRRDWEKAKLLLSAALK